MTKTLLLKCTQPFAQYRNPFTFYYAQTFPLQPKSTIIGMLQNAVGDWYGNKYGIDNWWNLKISVHGGFESTFWNYSSMIKGDIFFKENGDLVNKQKTKNGVAVLPLYGNSKTSQRTPVNMQELYNGHLWIFIRSDNFPAWPELKKALEEPRKVFSLGRSEDIIFVKSVQEVIANETKCIGKNLWLHYPTYFKWGMPLKNKKFPVYSMASRVVFTNQGIPIKNKSELNSNTLREAKFDPLIYSGLDYAIYLKQAIMVD